MTGGTVVILGDVGDNFAAGMTGGMAFIFDPESKLENLINPNSVTWNKVEVEYWKQYLKNLVQDHAKLTRSKYSQKILYEWDVNINSFIQVCPIEMLDKIEHPITNKISEKKAS
jgi:glutamate synthase (NADPH/NADH) large chain